MSLIVMYTTEMERSPEITVKNDPTSRLQVIYRKAIKLLKLGKHYILIKCMVKLKHNWQIIQVY